jgi:hypothetical protein
MEDDPRWPWGLLDFAARAVTPAAGNTATLGQDEMYWAGEEI